ncbi:p-loop containing nucleoside triphosphate hydrolase protein [Mycena indigotica]|uniref:p-loop containing nucleoside triphosphate hydrolase protein n=1 Tax=Mycena indigotica TaxID=2126181 RepID=A0A8H6VYU7_9AGAR|nr:p-loop containing nucleoside triphosphate hydrolase protein [Mycena indigotica]KAF7298832.1 p-loop containing nucleoside triphosphate hydrolase protein [Mycena indigotica]
MTSRWGSMRIAALPLTRGRPPITYYSLRMQRPPPPPHIEPPKSGWLPREGIVKWAVYKVDSTWTSWGQAKPGTVRFRVFEFGERFLDRLDFEEGVLKRIDVEHAPPTKPPSGLVGVEREEAEAALAQLKIPLLYAPKVTSAPEAISNLQAFIQNRIPIHSKGFWTYLLIAPLTAPFVIIRMPLHLLTLWLRLMLLFFEAVIPNIPFFFCAWRAWSHYQALQGARYIDGLLKTGKIVPQSLMELDSVYETPTTEEGNLIVSRNSLGNAMRTLEMSPDDSKDIIRAYEQVRNRSK